MSKYLYGKPQWECSMYTPYGDVVVERYIPRYRVSVIDGNEVVFISPHSKGTTSYIIGKDSIEHATRFNNRILLKHLVCNAVMEIMNC